MIKLELTEEMVNIILKGLAELPLKYSAQAFNEIKKQADEQKQIKE